MLKLLVQNKIKLFWFILLVALLGLVRAFESQLFYDPLLEFFKGEYSSLPLPEMNGLYLFFGILFRYAINSILSILIIYVIFNDKEIVVFSSLLYLVFFIVLILVFFGMLYGAASPNYLLLFYLRRFLIQPILLVLFIPAFYYQKLNE